MIPVIDWHCDVLYKLEKDASLRFLDSEALDVNLQKMKQGGIKVQAFALFVDPDSDDKFSIIMRQIECFKTQVLSHPTIRHIKDFNEIHALKDDEIGVFLTLEGLDCIESDLDKLHLLLDMGVLSVGITWNYANLACDGIMEPRQAGLSHFGYQVIDILNKRNCYCDVAHISKQGFEDVIQTAHKVIASHCNTRSLCDHPRNLDDQQLLSLKKNNAHIHIVYYDAFTTTRSPATLDHLLDHIEHLVHLGLENHIGLGSDFDGIDSKIENLEDASKTQNLIRAIESRFGIALARKISYQNFMRHIKKPKVGFICVHNSCRSQIAEALGKRSHVFEAFSAGTHTKDRINDDAVRIMKTQYGIDMTLTQAPKTLEAIPDLDIVITMGCNVDCPYLPAKHREDWGLDDPSGQSDAIFLDTIQIIESKIKDLEERIQRGALPL